MKAVSIVRGYACWFALASIGCSAGGGAGQEDGALLPNNAAGAAASGGASGAAGAVAGIGGSGGFTNGASGSGGGLGGMGAGSGTTAGIGGGGAIGGGAIGGGAGGTSAGSAGGAPIDPSLPRCMSNPSQVAIIGDSYINWPTHTFPSDLALAAGNDTAGIWDVPPPVGRLHAVGGVSMASGGLTWAGGPFIPDQLNDALAQDPDIIALIMDGGGNDVLLADASWPGGAECKNSTLSPTMQVCRDIAGLAFDAASTLMDTAANAGIRDIVYFYYPHVPLDTALGGANPNAILDYALPMVKALCDGAYERTGQKLRCHMVDMVPVFEGHPEWFAPTDIHPNPEGSKAMADAVIAKLKEKCIAQPASSGCCNP